METTLTEEQRKKRLGRFTASEIHKLMGARGLGKTGETYIYEKVAEFATGEEAHTPFSAAIAWGIEHELEAKLYYEAATGHKIYACNTLFNGHMSATPDGIVKNEGVLDCGFEIKCPYNKSNHLKNLQIKNVDDLAKFRSEYYWQIVAGMWVFELKKWKFCSYDPRFKEEKRMIVINVHLNDKNLELLKERVAMAKNIYDDIVKSTLEQ